MAQHAKAAAASQAGSRALDDPALDAIFAAMVQYMGTSYITMACTVAFDGAGQRNTVNCTSPNGRDNWQYQQYFVGTQTMIAPTTASLGPGQTQQFSAQAVDASGNPVASPSFTWSLQPGAVGTVSATGLYTAPASITAAASDILRCSLDGANSWAQVTVNLRTS